MHSQGGQVSFPPVVSFHRSPVRASSGFSTPARIRTIAECTALMAWNPSHTAPLVPTAAKTVPAGSRAVAAKPYGRGMSPGGSGAAGAVVRST